MCNKQKRDWKAKVKQKNNRAMRQRRKARFKRRSKGDFS